MARAKLVLKQIKLSECFDKDGGLTLPAGIHPTQLEALGRVGNCSERVRKASDVLSKRTAEAAFFTANLKKLNIIP